ncbi:MAG: hypothetical protein AABX84_00470, partial [Nanoarchaeota archaeon]
MKGLTVLIVGSGAREHVISEAYEKSPQVEKCIIAPGNDFIAWKREKEVIIDGNCSLKDPSSILILAKKYKPDLIDVAQDDALASGTVDLLQKYGFITFGPTWKTAKIESDKCWSKKFMRRNKIPTSEYRTFHGPFLAQLYVRNLFKENPNRIVYIKASGLCGGKGALRATSLEQTLERIEQMKDFGKAGKVFLIEQGLEGEEFSYFAISDGENYKVFKSARDYKLAFDNDQGGQTGGMGSVSPTKITNGGIDEEIQRQFVSKAIKGMKKERNP